MSLIGSALKVVKTGTDAVGGLAKGVSSMLSSDDKNEEGTKGNTVINNIGIAGSAGQQKVVGRGTIPGAQNAAKLSVSDKMPTDKLLKVAVNYLASIDNSLRAQINLDKKTFEDKKMAEREAIVEKKSFDFAGMKSAVGEQVQTVKNRGSFAAKALLGAFAGMAVLGSLIDEKQMDALNESVDNFKKNFKWLFDLGAAVGTGTFIGWMLGGWKGAIAGAVAQYLYDRGNGTGSPNAIMAGGLAAYSGYQAFKGVKGLKGTFGKIKAIKARPIPMPSLSGSGAGARFIDPVTKKMVKTETAVKAGSWLSGKMGQSFLRFLGNRFGKTWVMRKLFPLLARVLAGIGIAATGIGAIPGALWTLVNIGLNAWMVYDLIKALWDWYSGYQAEEANADAKQVKQEAKPDAVKANGAGAMPSTGIKSKSETGRPEEAQSFFENNGWTKEQAAGIVGNLVVESGLRTNAVGDGGQAYGIAQWHPDRQEQFRKVYGKDIRDSSFQEQLQFVNWELNNTEKRAGAAIRATSSAEDAAAAVDRYYERSSGAAIAERQSNAAAIMAGDYGKVKTGGADDYGGGATNNLIQNSFESTSRMFGKLAATVFGQSGSSIKNINTPLPDYSAKISKETAKIQNNIAFGMKQDKQKDSVSEPAAASVSVQKSLSAATPNKTVECIDPNYPDRGGVMAFLGHYKLVAA